MTQKQICRRGIHTINQGRTMPEEDFIIAVFCCVDDLLQSLRNCWGFVGGASPPGSATAR